MVFQCNSPLSSQEGEIPDLDYPNPRLSQQPKTCQLNYNSEAKFSRSFEHACCYLKVKYSLKKSM